MSYLSIIVKSEKETLARGLRAMAVAHLTQV